MFFFSFTYNIHLYTYSIQSTYIGIVIRSTLWIWFCNFTNNKLSIACTFLVDHDTIYFGNLEMWNQEAEQHIYFLCVKVKRERETGVTESTVAACRGIEIFDHLYDLLYSFFSRILFSYSCLHKYDTMCVFINNNFCPSACMPWLQQQQQKASTSTLCKSSNSVETTLWNGQTL